MLQIAGEPILPGTGLGGVALGDPESKVLAVLGTATNELPIRSLAGELQDHAIVFRHDGVFLGVYTTIDHHVVHSLRLFDNDFDRGSTLPRLRGVGIGSTESELRAALGKPDSVWEHFTCPETLSSDRRATTLHYAGISFCVCAANNKVYWIDIP